DVLGGEQRSTGGDLADERQPRHVLRLRGRGLRLAPLAPDQLEGARLRRVAPEEPRTLEVRQVRVHGRRRGQADLLADLADGRRVAVPVDVLDEVVPDLLLTGREHAASLTVADGDERVFATRVETPADGVNGKRRSRPAGRLRMRWRGLEPPRPQWPLGPQPSASTNSATSAWTARIVAAVEARRCRRNAVVADDWRVSVTLADEPEARRVVRALHEREVQLELRNELGGRVAVSRDDASVFLYTATRRAAEAAERALNDVLDEQRAA